MYHRRSLFGVRHQVAECKDGKNKQHFPVALNLAQRWARARGHGRAQDLVHEILLGRRSLNASWRAR
eukprot:366399-Chlamydomonas_euryale.AAC.39